MKKRNVFLVVYAFVIFATFFGIHAYKTIRHGYDGRLRLDDFNFQEKTLQGEGYTLRMNSDWQETPSSSSDRISLGYRFCGGNDRYGCEATFLRGIIPAGVSFEQLIEWQYTDDKLDTGPLKDRKIGGKPATCFSFDFPGDTHTGHRCFIKNGEGSFFTFGFITDARYFKKEYKQYLKLLNSVKFEKRNRSPL